MWRDHPKGRKPRGMVLTHEVDPDTRGWNNPYARARPKVFALLFVRLKAPIRMCPAGCLSPIRLRLDTHPTGGRRIRFRIGDSHPTGRVAASRRIFQSNANTFVRARAYGLFQPRVTGSTSCVGTIPRGLRPLGWSLHTRLIPPHSLEYPHTSLASLKYCYNPVPHGGHGLRTALFQNLCC